METNPFRLPFDKQPTWTLRFEFWRMVAFVVLLAVATLHFCLSPFPGPIMGSCWGALGLVAAWKARRINAILKSRV